MKTGYTVLQARGLTRLFNTFPAVNGIDLDLCAGTITGLIGPNGAGKTTLMLMLSGMLAPSSGTIRLSSVSAHELSATASEPGSDYTAPGSPAVSGRFIEFSAQPRLARAAIGWLPDTFGSWGELKVGEIMRHFGRLHGLSPAAGAARATELLQLVHLEEYADKLAHVLSRGQKQRLGVARTLIGQPRILLLDEPAAGMDPRSRIELREMLRRLAKQQGLAVLISSHILSELEDMVDDAVFMKSGKVVNTAAVHEDTAAGDTSGVPYLLQVLDAAPLQDFCSRKGWNVTPLADNPREYLLHLEDQLTAAQLLSEITAAGILVTGYTQQKPSLEDLYLRIEEERK